MDQSGNLLPKPLLGHRLTECGYQELRPSGLVEGREAYYSAALGLLLRSRGHGFGLELVFRDPQSGKDIPVGEEMDRVCHAAERAAESERRARLEAEQAAETERAARVVAEQAAGSATRAAEAERSERLATQERLAQAEEALRRALAGAGSDLD